MVPGAAALTIIIADTTKIGGGLFWMTCHSHGVAHNCYLLESFPSSLRRMGRNCWCAPTDENISSERSLIFLILFFLTVIIWPCYESCLRSKSKSSALWSSLICAFPRKLLVYVHFYGNFYEIPIPGDNRFQWIHIL